MSFSNEFKNRICDLGKSIKNDVLRKMSSTGTPLLITEGSLSVLQEQVKILVSLPQVREMPLKCDSGI